MSFSAIPANLVRFAAQIGCHSLVVGMDAEIAVEKLSEDRRRTQIPARPGEGRISVHVLGIDLCARIEKKLDRFFVAESRGAMQGSLAFGAGIPHEAARFHRFFRHTVRIRAIGKKNFEDQVMRWVSLAQRGVQRSFSRVVRRMVHVRAALDQELAESPMPVEARVDESAVTPERIERRAVG